ncbi:glycosyltransferase [Agromyces sp. NPDC004153]
MKPAVSRTFADVSLIVTVLNESRSIDRFLESVGRLTVLPSEFVIIDGGSTDGTVERIEAWLEPPGMDVVVKVVPGANISEGRNIAISIASFPQVVVTDAGTLLRANWVERLTAKLHEGVDVASGFFEPERGHWMQSAIAAVITPTVSEINPAEFLPSSRSLGLSRSAWERAGGYPEWLDYCEDLVLDFSLQRTGSTFAFVPDAIVTWDARPSLRAFAKQYYRYARGDGKALLWPRRHALRYGAYTAGSAMLALSFAAPWLLAVLAFGFTAYVSKFVARVYRRRAWLGRQTLAAFVLLPVIVVVGDVAKMLGYPVGRLWRARMESL